MPLEADYYPPLPRTVRLILARCLARCYRTTRLFALPWAAVRWQRVFVWGYEMFEMLRLLRDCFLAPVIVGAIYIALVFSGIAVFVALIFLYPTTVLCVLGVFLARAIGVAIIEYRKI